MKTIIGTLLVLASLTALADSDSEIAAKAKIYEVSKPVKKTLTYMHNNVLASSTGQCAAFVRKGFMNSGMMSYPGIDYAKDYLPFLTREGWTNIFSSQKVKSDLNTTPAGCAIIYDAINPQNDRNGYIGHIEVRTKGVRSTGYISDYFSSEPRTGLACDKKGKVITRTRTFIARDSSPYHKGGSKVVKNIQVTTCDKYSTRAAIIADEYTNRKVIGVSCKFE